MRASSPVRSPLIRSTVRQIQHVMTFIRTLWYYAGLFTLAFVLSSVISVVPEAEHAMDILRVTLLVLAICSVVSALLLHRLLQKDPGAFIFTSKVPARIAMLVAIFLTLFLFLGLVG